MGPGIRVMLVWFYGHILDNNQTGHAVRGFFDYLIIFSC